MYHQDPTGTLTKMSVNGKSDLKTGLDRRRAAGSRLSCISEHQKENTPNSEDDYFCPPTQAIKTPSLEPLRRPYYRHIKGKSQSSGDSSAISPLQLDSEQMDGSWSERTHHQLVLSSWRCVASDEHKEKTERYEPPDMKSSSGILEVRWQTIRWTETQRRNIDTKEPSHGIPGTGFDGPCSSTSENSPFDSPSSISRPPLGALALSNCMPCTSRSSKSNTSGSIDWEKSWPKRKPQRRHDVSESSDREQLDHEHPASAPTMEIEEKDKTDPLKHGKKDQSRYSDVQDSSPKSCPGSNRQSPPAVVPATSRFSPGKVPGLESPDYSRFESSPHQHRRHFPNTVSRRFRSLRDKLHRSRSSSMFSTRPEFPPPPDGKERRYRSRNSNDIWPSSGEESPIFNTPASNISPVPPVGHNASLLAASGLMMAAADIDRLTGSAYEGNGPRMPGTRSLELPRPRLPSGANSSPSESGSSGAEATPIVPDNSPSSPIPSTGLSSPVSRLPQRPGRKSRRQPSRLSEVTTPEEINSPTQPGDCDINLPQIFWSGSKPRDTSEGFEDERQETSSPLPLLDSQSRLLDDKTNSESSLASVSEMVRSRPNYINHSEQDESSSQKSSLRDQNLELDHEQTESDDEGETRESNGYMALLGITQLHSRIRPPIVASKSRRSYEQSLKAELERLDIVAQESALFADVMERLDTGENASTMAECGSSSCHPDTWSEDQGEPGDSEPFCPPDCLYSKRCGHDSEP